MAETLRELIAKELYELEFSHGYWDEKMSNGDKVKWLYRADSILNLIKEQIKGKLLKDEEIALVIKEFLIEEDAELDDYEWMVGDEDRKLTKAQLDAILEIFEV
jgi:hypothetical protein